MIQILTPRQVGILAAYVRTAVRSSPQPMVGKTTLGDGTEHEDIWEKTLRRLIDESDMLPSYAHIQCYCDSMLETLIDYYSMEEIPKPNAYAGLMRMPCDMCAGIGHLARDRLPDSALITCAKCEGKGYVNVD